MLFPLEIWDLILSHANLESLVPMSGTCSYFRWRCETHLERETRASFPWATESLCGEPNGEDGTWRLSGMRVLAKRRLRPDFRNPTGSQRNCQDTLLRRFPSFDSSDHTSRPFFYDKTFAVVEEVQVEDLGSEDLGLHRTPPSEYEHPVDPRDRRDGKPPRYFRRNSPPVETEDYFFKVFVNVDDFNSRAYLHVIDKATCEVQMFQIPIDDDEEPPVDAASVHNNRLFVTIARGRSFMVFYFNATVMKFTLVLRATGNYGMFYRSRVLADLNTIRVLSDQGYFFTYEVHGLYTAPDFEPKTILGFTSQSPKPARLCYLTHPRSKLTSSRYVAWFAEENDFDVRRTRQSLMCVVADLQEYRMWRIPMLPGLLVVGLYYDTIGCWMLEEDPAVNSKRARRNLLARSLKKWREDHDEFWIINQVIK
ncbi:hypothetical protein CJU90_2165 [Yarrowia sp. C11]|nr:hypothetical protein CKK34_6193 [Yarrowia sp. E02]KAG5372088.1 hypothetical protein CJU90_2165 [Yarrowia sp. C11]